MNNKIYRTPNGIEYGVGTKYRVGDKRYLLEIKSISFNIISVDLLEPRIQKDYNVSLERIVFEGNIDDNTWNIVEDISNEQMKKEIIEVGDIVQVIENYPGYKNYVGLQGIVAAYYNDQRIMVEMHKGYEPIRFNINELKLVPKTNKQQIIGYQLLKDLPGIPAGTKSDKPNGFGIVMINIGSTKYTFDSKQLQDITWFKPIYKAKEEIVVKLSNFIQSDFDNGEREAIITNDRVDLSNREGEYMTFQQFEEFYKLFIPYKVKTGIIPYDFTLLRVKLGCQEFTKEDIEAVYQAIQQFKK